MTLTADNCGLAPRDFTPQCLTDLAVDYSILLPDEMQSIQRAKLAKKCRHFNLSVITQADLDDAVTRRCFPTRSIFVVLGGRAVISESLKKQLAGLSFMVVPDFFVESLIDGCVKAQIKFNETVANRLGLPISYVSQAPLINGWTNSSSASGSFGNSIATIQSTMQAASANGTSFVSTMRGDSAQVLSMVFAIQDIYHLYAPQFSDSVKCDVPLGVSAVVPPTFLNNQSYTPIQMLPMLCDDPSSAMYYINDCRPIGLYIDNCTPNVPLPRLFIRPQIPVPQIMPNIELAIYKGENVIKISNELTKGYTQYENMVKAVIIMLAKIYYNAILEARHALELIKETIFYLKTRKEATVKPHDFCCNKKVVEKDQSSFPEIDFSKLPITPEIASVYPDLIMDYDELGLVFGYRLLGFSNTKKTWSSWDMQAPIVASPLGSYFLDNECFPNKHGADQLLSSLYFDKTPYTTSMLDTTEKHIKSEIARLRARDSDDVIIIRPTQCSNRIIAVPRNGRPFTTYQLINSVVYLCKNMYRINKVTRSSSEGSVISSKGRSMTLPTAQLNKFGIPLRTLLDYTNSASYRRQVSETDDNEEGLHEDRSRGKCAVCAVNYMNYFDHVRSHVHIEKYRELLRGLNIYKPLQKSMAISEYKVSMHRQLANTIMFIVTQEQKPYDVVAEKLNECLSAMGSRIRVDPFDTPRSNSPTCRTSAFSTWRERTFRTQQQAFNENLIKSIDYYGDVLTTGIDPNILKYDNITAGMVGAVVNGTGSFLRTQKQTGSSPLNAVTKSSSSLESVHNSFQSYCDLLMQATFSSIGFSNNIRAIEILQDTATNFFPVNVLNDLHGKIDLKAPIKVPFRGIEDLIPDRVLYKPLYDIRREIMNNYLCSAPSSRDSSLLEVSLQPNDPRSQDDSKAGQILHANTYEDNIQNELIDEYIFQNTHKAHNYDSFSAYNDEMYMFYQDYVRECLNFRYGHFLVDDIHKNIIQQPQSIVHTSSEDRSPIDYEMTEVFEPLDDNFIKIYEYLAKSFYKLPVTAHNSLNVKIFAEVQGTCNEAESEQSDFNQLSSSSKIDAHSRNLDAMTDNIIYTQERSYVESLDSREHSAKLSVGSSHGDRLHKPLTSTLSCRSHIETPMFGSDGVESSAPELNGSLPHTEQHSHQHSDLIQALIVHDSETSVAGLVDDSMCYRGAFNAVSQQPIEVRPYIPETMLRDDVNALDAYLGTKTERVVIKPYTLIGAQSAIDMSSDTSAFDRGDGDTYDHDSAIGGFIKKLGKICVSQSGSGCTPTSGQRSPCQLRDKRMDDVTIPTHKGVPLVLPSITRILNTHLPLNQTETFGTIYELAENHQGRIILPPEYEIRAKQLPNMEDYLELFHIDEQSGPECCTFIKTFVDDYHIPMLLLKEIGGINGSPNPAFYPVICTLMKSFDKLFPVCSHYQDEHDIPISNEDVCQSKADYYSYIDINETSMDDSILSEPLHPRIKRCNSIPGPIRLSPDSISIALLVEDSPAGLDVDDPVMHHLFDKLLCDISPIHPTDNNFVRPVTTRGSNSDEDICETITGLYAGPQLYEKTNKGRRVEDSTTYVSTQVSGSDCGSVNEHVALPDIQVFSTLKEAYRSPRELGEHVSLFKHHNYLTSIIKAIDMDGNPFPQFCTLPRSVIYSINSSLITSYMLGNNALLNACSVFDAVSNSVVGVSTQNAMIQPIHLAILQAGVTSKLRSDRLSLGYDCFVKRKYTSKILMEKHPRPSVYDCDGLGDELLNILMNTQNQ